MNSRQSPYKVEVKDFFNELEVPSSKSYGNRLLVLAAISKEDITISNLPLSNDVETMITCLSEIGLTISRNNQNVTIGGSFPDCEKKESIRLYTGDGGTTNRFLMSLLALGSSRYTLVPSEHMSERPMNELIEVLRSLGATIEYKKNSNEWITVRGPIKAQKTIEVDSSQSTQFVTSVALSLANTDSKVVPKVFSVSKTYWYLTQDLVTRFKKDELDYHNPIDFSSLSYPIALASVCGEVKIKNFKKVDHLQADSVFIEILKNMGAYVEQREGSLVVKHKKLVAIEYDGSQCPDVIPTLLYVCSFAQGMSRIYNLEVLTHKECDRFRAMIRMLEAFHVKFEIDYENYELKVYGGSSYLDTPIEYMPEADHRMVMVSYLFMRSLAGGKLHNSEHVKKSFANFFEVMD